MQADISRKDRSNTHLSVLCCPWGPQRQFCPFSVHWIVLEALQCEEGLWLRSGSTQIWVDSAKLHHGSLGEPCPLPGHSAHLRGGAAASERRLGGLAAAGPSRAGQGPQATQQGADGAAVDPPPS